MEIVLPSKFTISKSSTIQDSWCPPMYRWEGVQSAISITPWLQVSEASARDVPRLRVTDLVCGGILREILYCKWWPTATCTFGLRVVDDCEGAPDELLLVVNSTAFDELERSIVYNYMCTVSFKYPIAFRIVIIRIRTRSLQLASQSADIVSSYRY